MIHVASYPWVTVLGLLLPLWEYASYDTEMVDVLCAALFWSL